MSIIDINKDVKNERSFEKMRKYEKNKRNSPKNAVIFRIVNYIGEGRFDEFRGK
jgi:hypothetical protein